MRLTEMEKAVIKAAFRERDADADVYLFGSRADDTKRGGDIDLLVLSQKLQRVDVRKIRWEIMDQIGEQKIDIVLARDTSKPFTRIALSEGVLL